jgi:hypothetical protein
VESLFLNFLSHDEVDRTDRGGDIWSSGSSLTAAQVLIIDGDRQIEVSRSPVFAKPLGLGSGSQGPAAAESGMGSKESRAMKGYLS